MKKLVVFEGKNIRRTWYNNEWYFSVVDVVDALEASTQPRKYWSDLKVKLIGEGFELSDKIGQLKLMSSDNKYYETDCANTKNLFRIIQSIPSKKAEPFKQWLAQVGYERIQEIQNPELAQERIKQLYIQKGYSKEWIEKRLRGIAIRQELTDEWKQRGVEEGKEFSIFTNEISKATFGMTVQEYKKFKGLKTENLRDHMKDLELIFTMLSEASTTTIARGKDAQGFHENKEAAKEGGTIAGNARKELEDKSRKKVVTSENYLKNQQNKKLSHKL